MAARTTADRSDSEVTYTITGTPDEIDQAIEQLKKAYSPAQFQTKEVGLRDLGDEPGTFRTTVKRDLGPEEIGLAARKEACPF